MTEQAQGGALQGLRVIDLSAVLSGPAGTQILGDMGADVIKVEPPAGDETRRMGAPAWHDGSAAAYVNTNRNKRSISVDLQRPEGRDLLLRLLEGADVLVENFKPGTLAKWGLDYDTVLKTRFPRLIHCQITAFGADGPLGGLPGYDPIAQGYGGILGFGGFPGGPPLRLHLPAVDYATALYSVIAIQGALLERARSGQGQAIEVTLYDSALSLLHPFACNWLLRGVVPQQMGNRHSSAAPYDIYPTRDGHIVLLVVTLRQFHNMCDALGLSGLRDDPQMQATTGRVQHNGELEAAIVPVLAGLTTDEAVAQLNAAGVPVAPVLDVGQALSHPHAAVRGAVVEGDEGYRGVASPLRFSRTPVSYRIAPPRQGAHGREILAEARLDPAEAAALIEKGVVIAPPVDET